ncbi:hypothetical protein B0T11DRAFT_323239 [Plectosphaerella cucumerina]|uniref:Uncharacterized protein n=1 Tax=Plectosphaerella cucumerina TaxID=40658 RepID=A0A8K0TUQ1_9PEZI|nr:hypothetical protein B0T11DRAFT_323239 [Plectosphaerella cucumerina]
MSHAPPRTQCYNPFIAPSTVSSPRYISILPTMPDSPPLTAEEKAWLNKHYGGEFHFLHSYGLSIHKEEDREEGRRIVRGLISADSRK